MARRSHNHLLERACEAKRESATVDFKAEFDVTSTGDWCEIVKDVIAMANSGGGVIVVGVNDDGTPSSRPIDAVLALDPANVTNKIRRYTDAQLDIMTIHEITRVRHVAAALIVSGISTPVVFTKPGEYIPKRDGLSSKQRQKSAFAVGTVYFRHGAKSEPGTSDDIRHCIEREVERQRRLWLGNIRKVSDAPADAVVHVSAPGTDNHTAWKPDGPIYLTTEPSGTPGTILHAHHTHPYWLKDVLRVLNERLALGRTLNPHDVLSVRRVHHTDEREEFCYKSPMQTVPQYSLAFVEWIVEQCVRDPEFITKARAAYRSLLRHESRIGRSRT